MIELESIPLFGSEQYFITQRGIFNKLGEKLEPENNKLTVDFFGNNITVSYDWLWFINSYSAYIPEKILSNPQELVVTTNVLSRGSCSKRNSLIVWFKEPIEIKNGWYIIPRYPNYIVNKDGFVISRKTGKMINTSRCTPYRMVTLHDLLTGKQVDVVLHRLLLLSINPPETVESYISRPIVNHIDGDKTHTCVDNLEWVSFKENVRHAVDNRLVSSVPCVVLNLETNEEIKFPSLSNAGQYIGFTGLSTSQVKNRLNQKPFKEKFKIQLQSDFVGWTNYHRNMFTIIETDVTTNEVYEFKNVNEFRKKYSLWNKRGRGGLKKMVDLVNSEQTSKIITFTENYSKISSIQIRHISTSAINTYPSIREAARKGNLSFTFIQSLLKRGDGFSNRGYQIRYTTQSAWCTNPKDVTKTTKFYCAFNEVTNDKRMYKSEREFSRLSGIPYMIIRRRTKSGKCTYGDYRWEVLSGLNKCER